MLAEGVSQDKYSAGASCLSRSSLAMRFTVCTLKPQGVTFMGDIFLGVVCLVVGFVGGYFFAKTKAAKEFETKAGKIGDVIRE